MVKYAGIDFTAKDLLHYCIVYPFALRAMYLVWQFFDPIYMNSTCLMDFVRLSSPDHYDVHPIWKHFQKATNETCESITGQPIQEHFNQVYHNGTTEFYVFYGWTFLYTILSLYSFIKYLFAGKVRSVIGIAAAITLAWWGEGSLMHLFSHYQNDCSHLNGNVMHHSSFTVGGDNSALNKTLPPGLLINFSLNLITVKLFFWVILDYFKIDKQIYFGLSTAAILAKFVIQMKFIHPYIHQYHKSWYREFIHPMFPMDEYKGHVLCHHVSGYCLGDSPIYTWFYDNMLYYHGKVYELGYIKYKTMEHYIFNFALDYFLIISTIGFCFITIALFSPFMQKVVEKPSSEKATKKVN